MRGLAGSRLRPIPAPLTLTLSPRTGRGRGEGTSFVALDEDGLQDAVEILIDFVVGDADHAVASVAQETCSPLIPANLRVGGVRRPVDLDDELSLPTDQIGEVGSDRLLANELEAAEPAIAKRAPENRFSVGVIRSQGAGATGFDDPDSTYRLARIPFSPLAPRSRGEG